MGGTEKSSPGFVHLRRAWYRDAVLRDARFVDEVNIGMFVEGGGVAEPGEFNVRWIDLSGIGGPANEAPTAQLRMMQDSWGWISNPKGAAFLEWLSGRKRVTPEQVCEWLSENGFADRTPEEQP